MHLFNKRKAERELEEEFQFHLEKHIEAGIATGLSPHDARAAALRALDRIELRKEECRDHRPLAFLDSLAQDLRYAVRVLRKSPAFTTVAILSLALGIGANTAIFSVMDVLLLRPLPVKQPERLELLRNGSFSYEIFEKVRDRNAVFSETAAWSTGGRDFQTPEGDGMQLIRGVLASGDYFAALGVPPAIGRTFGPEDDQPAGGKNGPVVVISDALWSNRYRRSAAVIGQPITLNAVAVTIIGIMPAGFFGAEVGTAPDIWLPLNLTRRLQDSRCIASDGCWWLQIFGRLKPGVTERQADAQLASLSPGITRQTPRKPWTLHIAPGIAGFSRLRRQVDNPLQVLMALVGFVLLIACANTANLLTARASARQREVAVRLAMGASRARVMRQFMTESLLLAIAGAAGGFLIAIEATRALIALLSTTDDPIVLDLRPDWRVLLFTAAAALGTGLLFGLAPALRATRAGVGAALKERTHQIQSSGRRFGFTRLLLGAQVALSIVLLAAAGMLAGSLVRLLTETPGFDPHNVAVISVDSSKLPQKGPALDDLFGTLVRHAAMLPGAESAAVLSMPLLTGGGWSQGVAIPGRSDLTDNDNVPMLNAVSGQFFRTFRIPILSGRAIEDSDDGHMDKVAVISQSAAHRWFPNGDAVGSTMLLGDGPGPPHVPLRIVGISGDIKYLSLRDPMPTTAYVSYRQFDQSRWGLYIAVRTKAPLGQTHAAFREMLRQVAPAAPIKTIRSMEQQVNESLSTERLTAYLSVFFGTLALLLTAVGLYGILAYSVSRRTCEIGVRMALGAQRGNVVWLVLREAMGHTAFGAIAGIVAVAATSKFIASLLYEVKPGDPAMLFAAVAALALVCAAAAWIPARRASRLDPMVALREE